MQHMAALGATLGGVPLAGGGGAARQRRPQAARRLPAAPRAGLFDAAKDFLDFESWAPKSSQAWRLGNGPVNPRSPKEEKPAAAEMSQGDVDVLNERLAEARQGSPVGAAAAAAAAADDAAAAAEQQQPSFLRSTDEEVSAALAERIAEVASTRGGSSAAGDGDGGGAEGAGLTGPLIKELLLAKWGLKYDVSFVRRDLPLGKTLICLNVMWTHVDQRSFPMTEEEYDDKLDTVALYLNEWGQAERVESFLRQPARPRKGMPSKPIVGTAISIQLDPDDGVISEFFSQGGA